MTYRDADTYAGIVVQGPLYPLNSLMLHGTIFARHAKHLNDDPHGDFAREVHSCIATGTAPRAVLFARPALRAKLERYSALGQLVRG